MPLSKIQVWFDLWCLTPLSQYFSYIMAVSFIGGGKWGTQRNPPTCPRSLTNLSHNVVSSTMYTSPEQDSNS
jgi:hypothetical protein